MNLFRFYEQLETAIQHGLDVSFIPNNEIKELFDNLNDLINKAREYDKNCKNRQIMIPTPAGGNDRPSIFIGGGE